MVAQPIKNTVSGDKRGRLADEAGTVAAQNFCKAGEQELSVEAWDRLELVKRAAGVAERAAGDHRHANAGNTGGGGVSHPGCRENGRDQQRRFIADAAGGVLVDGVGAQGARVEDLARAAHGVCQGGELGGVESAQKDGHQKCGYLCVAYGSGGGGLDEAANLALLKRQSVALMLNDLNRMQRGAHSGTRRKEAGSRSASVHMQACSASPG